MTRVLPELSSARAAARARLLAERDPSGAWRGELSSSALSTATAVAALELSHRAGVGTPAERATRGALAAAGLEWLAAHANADGGFGDTTDSPSNVSTTTLAWVALCLHADAVHAEVRAGVERWLERSIGTLAPERLARAILAAYGDDRTFSVPILVTCALGGRLGSGRSAWRSIPALPYEIAALPQGLFRFVGLPMVSYALPALIAIGHAIEHHRPTRNPLTSVARRSARRRVLGVLARIQPATGGFLEATPLTAFVTLSLVASGAGEHPCVGPALAFLERSARGDGSWPIDTDLATWLTTLSVHALAGDGLLAAPLDGPLDGPDEEVAERVRHWLLAQQYQDVHPYTGAAPGGWAWTDLAGGVPDADDTAGALLALARLGALPEERAAAGVRWLVDLQNRDGGIPTFCRGWGKLPFDRSSPDLTAHALRAWEACRAALPADLAARVERAGARAASYLARVQRADGAWVPLWFGSQRTTNLANPLYGTSRVVLAGRALCAAGSAGAAPALERGVTWLLAAQHQDGGFGAEPGVDPTVEETALAVEALAQVGLDRAAPPERVRAAVERGARWLVERTLGGTRFEPSPIGLYFAKLWYSERLYPLVFCVSALERAGRLLERET